MEHQELLKQETDWNSLHKDLSDIVHKQKHCLVADLDYLWTKLIDHLFTILGIINLEA